MGSSSGVKGWPVRNGRRRPERASWSGGYRRPGVEKAPIPAASHACGTWEPRQSTGSPTRRSGRPTVREAESSGGNRMLKKRMPVDESRQETNTRSRSSSRASCWITGRITGSRMERERLRLPPWASHPAVTHDARQGGDGPSDTGPDHTLVKLEPPIGVITHSVRPHVARATSDWNTQTEAIPAASTTSTRTDLPEALPATRPGELPRPTTTWASASTSSATRPIGRGSDRTAHQ